MVQKTQIIRGQQSKNCLSVFDHFVRLAFKALKSGDQLARYEQRNIEFKVF